MIKKFLDYKKYVAHKLKKLKEKQGKTGANILLADFLRVNPSFVSQVTKGNKHFSKEQALGFCQFFKLSELETEYFLLLVEWEKAGTFELKKFLQKKCKQLRAQFKEPKGQLDKRKTLSVEQQSLYYSDWIYSAVKLLCTKDQTTFTELSKQFKIPKERLIEVLHFLVESGICTKTGNIYKTQMLNTHLSTGSPFIKNHHRNWRLKFLQRLDNLEKNEMAFSAPLGISKEGFQEIRDILLETIKRVGGVVDHSKTDFVACLNMDFTKVK